MPGRSGAITVKRSAKTWNDWLPHPRRFRIAMQKYERRTVAGGHVVQLGTLDLRSARDDGFPCSLSVGRGGEDDKEKEWSEYG
ncbi:MAG: hypothetical protein WB660_05330 [Candidatus Sulfotelmatobacter sp.]